MRRTRRVRRGRYPVETNRPADTSFVVLPAKRVTQLSNGAVCVRARVCPGPEESGEAKVAIKESKRRLGLLTSRLVSASDSPTIFPWRPAAPQRLWHLGQRTAVITLTR